MALGIVRLRFPLFFHGPRFTLKARGVLPGPLGGFPPWFLKRRGFFPIFPKFKGCKGRGGQPQTNFGEEPKKTLSGWFFKLGGILIPREGKVLKRAWKILTGNFVAFSGHGFPRKTHLGWFNYSGPGDPKRLFNSTRILGWGPNPCWDGSRNSYLGPHFWRGVGSFPGTHFLPGGPRIFSPRAHFFFVWGPRARDTFGVFPGSLGILPGLWHT